jgi:hypothetical protein
LNYLQLTQALHRESGSGGVAPSTLVGVTGENLRLTQWIQQADLLIQELYTDWQFRWAQQTVALVADTYLYAPTDAVAEFDRKTFKVDGMSVECVNYLAVKSDVRETTTGSPYQVVIMPDGTLRTDPTPAASGSLTFDYWAPPVALAVDADISIIPARFHLAIVGKALMMYAEYEAAEEIMKKGLTMYAEWLNKLETNQLPGDRYMQNTAEGNDMMMCVE